MLPVHHGDSSYDETRFTHDESQSFLGRDRDSGDRHRNKNSNRAINHGHHLGIIPIYQCPIRCHRWLQARSVWVRTLIYLVLGLLILLAILELLPTPTRRPPQPLLTNTVADKSHQPVALPPRRPHGHCPVYSYVVPLDNQEIDIGHQIEVWDHYWRSLDFEPIILTPEYAEQHPLYEQYLARVRTYPTVNNRKYEEACYLRWLALAVVGGGLFLDFDILYAGNVTYLHQLMTATDCGRMISTPISDGNNFPMVTISSSAGVEMMIQFIYNAQIEPSKDHTSDMDLLHPSGNLLQVRNLTDYTLTEFGFSDGNSVPDSTLAFGENILHLPFHFFHFSHAVSYHIAGTWQTDGVLLMVRWIQLRYFNTHRMLHLDLAPDRMERPKIFGQFFPLYLDANDRSEELMTYRQRRHGDAMTTLDHWYEHVFGVEPLPSYARVVSPGWERCWRAEQALEGSDIHQWWETYVDQFCFHAIQQGNEVDYKPNDYSWHRRQLQTLTAEQLRSAVTPIDFMNLFPPVNIDPDMWQTTVGVHAHHLGSELVLMLSVVHPWLTLAHGYMASRASSTESFMHWYRHQSLEVSPEKMSAGYDNLILHTLIRLVKEIGYYEEVDGDSNSNDFESCFDLLHSPVERVGHASPITWSTIASACFPHVAGVHIFLPGSSTDFCSSMCAFERSTGVATGAAGGSYVCGRVGHSTDPRFQTCQELTQTYQTQGINFKELFSGDSSTQTEQDLTSTAELIEEIRTRNLASVQLYQLMRQHIQQQAAPII